MNKVIEPDVQIYIRDYMMQLHKQGINSDEVAKAEDTYLVCVIGRKIRKIIDRFTSRQLIYFNGI
jgi:hypothetical protein